MGRLSQYIDYINRDKYPARYEIQNKYTHISIGKAEKDTRREYRTKAKLNECVSCKNRHSRETALCYECTAKVLRKYRNCDFVVGGINNYIPK